MGKDISFLVKERIRHILLFEKALPMKGPFLWLIHLRLKKNKTRLLWYQVRIIFLPRLKINYK